MSRNLLNALLGMALLALVASCVGGEDPGRPRYVDIREDAREQAREQLQGMAEPEPVGEPSPVPAATAAGPAAASVSTTAPAATAEREPASAASAASSSGAGPFDAASVRWEEVWPGGEVGLPVRLLQWPGGGMAVVDKKGMVSRVDDDGAAPILDISDRVYAEMSETGLVELALDPGWPERPFAYLWYTHAASGPEVEEPDLSMRLARMNVRPDGGIEPGTELVMLDLPKHENDPSHHGGTILFGDDGMLYLSLGDGGNTGNGQDRSTLWGSILRIDVSEATPERPYTVPGDNPFVDVPGARPELWAVGFRNVWRMSWSDAPGLMWVSDVGDKYEEINLIRAGDNGGWSAWDGPGCRLEHRCPSVDGVVPVHAYTGSGRAIIGGMQYDGSEIPALRGHYIFGDFVIGEVWALDRDGTAVALPKPGGHIHTFGTDGNGEVYVLSKGEPIRRLAAISQ